MRTLVFGLLACTALAATALQADETREPPMIFSLEIDGERLAVALDEEFEVATAAGSLKLVLRAEPHRLFALGGVRFHYPRHMAFEADLGEPGVKLWTLDGNSTVIMIQRFTGVEGSSELLDSVADGMASQYGRRNVQRSEVSLELEGRTVRGIRLAVVMAGTPLTQDLLMLGSGEDALLVILQDTPAEDGETSAESAAAFRMFQETFRVSG